MFALLKRSPLLRNTPLACILAAIIMILFLPVIGSLNLFNETAKGSNIVHLNGSILKMFLMIATLQAGFVHAKYFSISIRATELEMSLPVTLRHCIQHRMIAIWLAVVAPLFVACEVVALTKGIGSGSTGLIPTAASLLLNI